MKNGKIELMRFLFSIMIVFYHGQKHFMNINTDSVHPAFFTRGYIGVEFFFLLTGFLMAKSIYKKRENESNMDLGLETVRYTWRKIKAILPYHFVAFAILFAGKVLLENWTVRISLKKLFDMIPGILLIQKVGFNYNNLNSVEWYISCMIFAVMILYPICRRWYSMFVHVVAPVGGLFLLGYLAHTNGTFTGVSKWSGIVFFCVLRAIAEIALGCTVFEITQVMIRHSWTKNQKILLTGLEWCCYIFTFVFSASTIEKKYEIYVVFALMIALAISFSNLSYMNRMFDNRVCMILGAWSLPIYLSQVLALNIVKKLEGLSDFQEIALLLVITVVNAAVCKFIVYFIENVIRKHFLNHSTSWMNGLK